jgi:phenylacetate-CoA ligase
MPQQAHSTAHWSEAESWTPEQVRAEQNSRLQVQLGYLARSSAFYRRKAAEAGVALESIDAVADLALFPFTEKQELRDSLNSHPPLGEHLAADPADVIQVQASSGTTGSPSYVALTRDDQQVWNEMGARTFYAGGVRPGDRALHAFGMSKGFVGGLPLAQALQYMGVCDIPIGAEAGAERLLRVQADQRPSVLVGTPNFLVYLAEQAPGVLGVEAKDLGVRVISTGGEPGGGIPAVRRRIESLWGATSREMLGGTDLACLYWGECEQAEGMHLLSPDLMLAELIDPETGEVLPAEPGVAGELVYTALRRQASPVLRFRTRDQVVVTGTSCRCGRTGMLIRCVGRTDDMLIVRGINLFPSAVQDLVTSLAPRTTGALRIVADFPGHSTQQPLKLRVERGHDMSVDADVDLAAAITGLVSSALNVKTAVEVVDTGALGSVGAAKVQLVERSA